MAYNAYCIYSVTYVTSRERKLTIELGLSGFKIDFDESAIEE